MRKQKEAGGAVIILRNIFGYVLAILLILNFVDAFAALYWVKNGIASEANPLMQEWLHVGDVAFIFIKLIFALGCTACLWYLRNNRLANILIIIPLIIYTYVFIIHCNIAWIVFLN